MLTLGAAQLRAPVLLDLVTRPDSAQADTAHVQFARPTTKLADNGKVCVMADLKIESARTAVLTYRLPTITANGTWSHARQGALHVPTEGRVLTEPKVQAFINPPGTHVAIVATVRETSTKAQFSYVYVLGADSRNAPSGQDLAKVHYVGSFPNIQTACFDKTGCFFALAYENGKTSVLNVWYASDWTAAIYESSDHPPIAALAFSKLVEISGVRGLQSTASIHLAVAVKDSENVASVKQISLKTNSKLDAKMVEVYRNSLNTNSDAQLIYAPDSSDLICFSQDTHHCLIKTNQQQTSESVALQPPKNAACKSIAFTTDGSKLALGLKNGSVSMWEVQQATSELEPAKESPAKARMASLSAQAIAMENHPQHVEEVFSVRFSPDTKYLISASRDKLVLVYDTIARQLAAAPMVHHATVNVANVTDDGRYLSTLTRDIVFSWEFPTARWLPNSVALPNARTIRATARTTSNVLAVGGQRSELGIDRGWIRVISLDHRKELVPEIDLPRPVRHLAIHESGNWIAAIDIDGSAYLYQDSGKQIWKKANDGAISRLAVFNDQLKTPQVVFCSDANTLMSGSIIQRVNLAKGSATPDEVLAVPTEAFDSICVARFDSKGQRLVAGTAQGRMFLCSSREVAELTLKQDKTATDKQNKPHTERITSIVLQAEANVLLCGSEDDKATVWRLDKPDWQSNGVTIQSTNTANVNHVAVSESGQKLVIASADGQAGLFQWTKDKGNKDQGYVFDHKVKPPAGDRVAAPALVQADFVDPEAVICFAAGQTVRCVCTTHCVSKIHRTEASGYCKAEM